MRPDDPIFKQRPVNAAQRLPAGSRALFLALKDVLFALDGEGPVLLAVPIDGRDTLPPLLRAGRDEDAALALMPAGPLPDARARHGFFELVREAAEQIGTARPLVLLTDPVPVDPDDPEPAAERVHTLVDAGFTGVVLEASGLDADRAAAALVRAAAPAVERELGVAVLVPPDPPEAGRLVGALKLLGAEPDLVATSGADASVLSAMATEVDPVGLAWLEGEGGDFAAGLRHALGAGVRLLGVKSRFERAVRATVPAELSESERAEALAALDDDARDRMEVRIYGEAEDLVGLLKLKGSGRRIRDRLAP